MNFTLLSKKEQLKITAGNNAQMQKCSSFSICKKGTLCIEGVCRKKNIVVIWPD